MVLCIWLTANLRGFFWAVFWWLRSSDAKDPLFHPRALPHLLVVEFHPSNIPTTTKHADLCLLLRCGATVYVHFAHSRAPFRFGGRRKKPRHPQQR